MITPTDSEIVWHHALSTRRRAPVSIAHEQWAASEPAEAREAALVGLRRALSDFRAARALLVRRQAVVPRTAPVHQWYTRQIAERDRIIAAREALIAEVERDGMPPWPWPSRGGR
jgi:hypothetical protein